MSSSERLDRRSALISTVFAIVIVFSATIFYMKYRHQASSARKQSAFEVDDGIRRRRRQTFTNISGSDLPIRQVKPPVELFARSKLLAEVSMLRWCPQQLSPAQTAKLRTLLQELLDANGSKENRDGSIAARLETILTRQQRAYLDLQSNRVSHKTNEIGRALRHDPQFLVLALQRQLSEPPSASYEGADE